MELQTAASVISFARKFEEFGIAFYEALAKEFPEDREQFLSFAAENRKNIVQVERAYYGVISDALEGCFSFKIEVENYEFEIATKHGTTHRDDALTRALDIEKKTVAFYLTAAEQSKGLIADVSRAFALVARKRGERMEKVKGKGKRG